MPQSAVARLVQTHAASRVWARDTSVFSAAADPDVRAAILNRLGWLDAPAGMRQHLGSIDDVVASIRGDGLTDVCLLGMGGSSLCAEVLRLTLASPDTRDHMFVLDTTDEHAVRAISASLDPTRTLFVVASKSGSTVEVTALESYFRAWVTAAVGADAGRHFIAITDPGTTLVAHAAAHQYRHTFINPQDIGGRYSALSLFGLVSAALMHIPPAGLLDTGASMAAACTADHADNPGLQLGAFMAEHARTGRDKVTLLLPPSLAALGLWVEQLVAESTGKLGTGVLPIVDEPPAHPDAYGHDRAFVLVTNPGAVGAGAHVAKLAAAGHPVIHLEATSNDLGAEFFRWEFATAIAGALLNVNPFDEPNVRDAKARTMAILDGPRPLVVSPALTAHDGFHSRVHHPDSATAPGPGTFVALLDYLPVDDRRAAVVSHVRASILARTGAATTHGLGPRYLHSTGQFHKGGTNCGVFLLLTAADASQTAVPDADYTFSILKHAQALGDFEALCANGRSVIHVHLDDAHADFSSEMEGLVNWALRQWGNGAME
jgi:transaldolase/glucose-6-phosphate isomerase